MNAEYKTFESKKTLYYIAGLIVCFILGIGYTWSVVQTPFVQALGGESVTATVALCYTLTVLCSTMSPTILGGFTKHLEANQLVRLSARRFSASVIS